MDEKKKKNPIKKAQERTLAKTCENKDKKEVSC